MFIAKFVFVQYMYVMQKGMLVWSYGERGKFMKMQKKNWNALYHQQGFVKAGGGVWGGGWGWGWGVMGKTASRNIALYQLHHPLSKSKAMEIFFHFFFLSFSHKGDCFLFIFVCFCNISLFFAPPPPPFPEASYRPIYRLWCWRYLGLGCVENVCVIYKMNIQFIEALLPVYVFFS